LCVIQKEETATTDAIPECLLCFRAYRGCPFLAKLPSGHQNNLRIWLSLMHRMRQGLEEVRFSNA
jgi:hypothetical protein